MNEKRVEVKKEVALDVTKPPVDNRDSSKEKEGSKMEIVLASLLIHAKGDSKWPNQESLEAIVHQPKAFPQGKIVIKK